MKTARRRDLLKILHQGHASTQQEFVAALRARGHDVTQATVSRDLHELGAVKVRIGDQVAYRFPDDALRGGLTAVTDENLERQLAELAIDVRLAGSLVVVITPPGHAPVLARTIDLAAPPEARGTVAGDDTIFVATTDPEAAGALRDRWLSVQEKGST